MIAGVIQFSRYFALHGEPTIREYFNGLFFKIKSFNPLDECFFSLESRFLLVLVYIEATYIGYV